jgi:hypothetical protein
MGIKLGISSYEEKKTTLFELVGIEVLTTVVMKSSCF